MEQEIVNIVKGLVGNEYLYFSTALVIKLSPHSFPVNIWAVCVSPRNEIYVMDGGEEWTKIDESDDKVLQTLYQRVKSIEKTYKTAV